MGVIKNRKFAMDNSGVMWGTVLFVLFPGLLTFSTFAYETLTETPLIEPATAPTLAGMGIDYLWVIFALLTIITIFVYVAFGRAKPRKT